MIQQRRTRISRLLTLAMTAVFLASLAAGCSGRKQQVTAAELKQTQQQKAKTDK